MTPAQLAGAATPMVDQKKGKRGLSPGHKTVRWHQPVAPAVGIMIRLTTRPKKTEKMGKK
jgi:acyl dehydratase